MTDLGVSSVAANDGDVVKDLLITESSLFLLLCLSDIAVAARAVVDADDGIAGKDLLLIVSSLFMPF